MSSFSFSGQQGKASVLRDDRQSEGGGREGGVRDFTAPGGSC